MRSYGEVHQFCVRKLAQIIHDSIACSDTDRAMLDWLTAEGFILDHKGIVDGIYDCFQAATDNLFEQADYATFERICGRAVWDSLYQPLRRLLEIPDQPTPHYTCILFR